MIRRQPEDLLARVRSELASQDEKWGWPRPATFLERGRLSAGLDRAAADLEHESRRAFDEECASWFAILGEEVGEAFRERDPEALTEELIQVAAVALSWAQAIEEG